MKFGNLYPRARLRQRGALIRALSFRARMSGVVTDNIVLSGEPRGGTTWVANILQKASNGLVLWEPLRKQAMQRYSPILRETLGAIPHYVSPEVETSIPAVVESYFEDLFAGRNILSPLIHPEMPQPKLLHLFRPPTHVLKFCRANPALPYLASRYSGKFIYLIRHPLAVIASQYNHPAFDGMTEKSNFLLKERLDNGLLQPYQQLIENISTRDELFAAWWAFSNLPPIRQIQEGTHQFLPVAYERLYTSPESEILRIFEFLGAPVPESVWDSLQQSSFTTRSKEGSNISQLERWENTFGAERARSILDIIRTIGVTAYGADPEPDYSLLGYSSA